MPLAARPHLPYFCLLFFVVVVFLRAPWSSYIQIAHTLLVIQTMVDMYANETAVMGLQPVNEPWQFTPVDWLKVSTQFWRCWRVCSVLTRLWVFL